MNIDTRARRAAQGVHEAVEVREMTTQTKDPKPVERFDDYRDRKQRNRRRGALVAAAAIALVAVVLVLVVRPGESATTPAGTGPPLTAPDVPDDYVIDLNTGVMTPLPASIDGWRYAVSPDGSTLAYVGAADDGSPQIFIADIDGTRVRQMTHDLTSANWPTWSPDGTMIAHEGFDKATDLFVLDVATGASTQITDEGGYLGPYQFMPDGSSLLYTYTDPSSGSSVLGTVPVAGGKSTVLIGPNEGMGSAWGGSLSPDGSLVTMMGNEIGGPGAIRFVANADGTEMRSISGGGSNPAGTWSPDGSLIVCTNYAGDRILVVDIATGDASRVAEGRAAIWLDDHTLLVED